MYTHVYRYIYVFFLIYIHKKAWVITDISSVSERIEILVIKFSDFKHAPKHSRKKKKCPDAPFEALHLEVLHDKHCSSSRQVNYFDRLRHSHNIGLLNSFQTCHFSFKHLSSLSGNKNILGLNYGRLQ